MHINLFDVGSFIFIIHWLGLFASCHALLNARTSQGAIAWAFALFTFPYFSLLPYLFLGSSRFRGYVDLRRRGTNYVRAVASLNSTNRHSIVKIKDVISHRNGQETINKDFLDALQRLSGMSLTTDNQVRLLVNGDETFTAIFSAIATAKSYIFLQSFIIYDDLLGRKIADALIAAAQKKIKVYVLYDGIGSHQLPRRYINYLKNSGVEIAAFATQRIVNRFQLNFRNHRKLIIIDGQIAFVGGLNISQQYLGLVPPLSPWRDTHTEIQGPAIENLQLTFLEDWFWAKQIILKVAQPQSKPGIMHCQVIACGPADSQETCLLFFVAAINAATSRLWITSPYFIPDEAVFSALQLAVLRGVDVRILLPSRRDHRVVFAASSSYAHEAVRKGIKIYRYQPGFLHQKVLLIDNYAAAIGSPNLDNRSFRLNFELTVLTVDYNFALKVACMLENDLAQSVMIRKEDYLKVKWIQRALNQLARIFSPIL